MANYVQRVRRGASPGDGVFVPVSPACPLTRPNRMTVSPGTRAGRGVSERSIGDAEGAVVHIVRSHRVQVLMRVAHSGSRQDRRGGRTIFPTPPTEPRLSSCPGGTRTLRGGWLHRSIGTRCRG